MIEEGKGRRVKRTGDQTKGRNVGEKEGQHVGRLVLSKHGAIFLAIWTNLWDL